MLGLYIHIPFCQAICGYCNFNRGLLDDDLKARYVIALEREIREAGGQRSADTLFFGGGTPSLLEPSEVGALIAACADTFSLAPDAEITLETNPETATADRLDAFRSAGVTRISFGVQSFDDGELSRLDRIHSAERARAAVRAARTAGFQVSLDLMYWLPGQTRASWARTVAHALELESHHLSLYLLELYPNAPLRESMARVPEAGADQAAWALAADDDAADMYLDALAALDDAGYVQYEISNVARPGCQSRHNVKYWSAGNWRGFGCGAHSTVDGERWKNRGDTNDYIDRVLAGRSVAVDRHRLSPEARVSEALFTGLRLSAGIDGRNFEARFGVEPWSRYGSVLEPFVEEGLMWRERQTFGLTRRGMLVANEILAVFV